NAQGGNEAGDADDAMTGDVTPAQRTQPEFDFEDEAPGGVAPGCRRPAEAATEAAAEPAAAKQPEPAKEAATKEPEPVKEPEAEKQPEEAKAPGMPPVGAAQAATEEAPMVEPDPTPDQPIDPEAPKAPGLFGDIPAPEPATPPAPAAVEGEQPQDPQASPLSAVLRRPRRAAPWSAFFFFWGKHQEPTMGRLYRARAGSA